MLQICLYVHVAIENQSLLLSVPLVPSNIGHQYAQKVHSEVYIAQNTADLIQVCDKIVSSLLTSLSSIKFAGLVNYLL